MGCSSCQKNLLCCGLSADHSFVRKYPLALMCGPSRCGLQCDCLLWCSFHGLQENLFSSTCNTSYPFFFCEPRCSQSCFSLLSSLLTACAAFCPLSDMFAQRLHKLGWWDQLCHVVGLLWSWLELPPFSMWQSQSLLTEATPAAPHYRKLATYTQNKIKLYLGESYKYKQKYQNLVVFRMLAWNKEQ